MPASPPATVRSVLGWFDARAYGAKGDNATDDTAAIRAAIAACYAAGVADGSYSGTVYFPRGVYLIGGALQTANGMYTQIPLPNPGDTVSKFVLRLLGPSFEGSQCTLGQTLPQAGGAVLKSTLTGCTFDATFGTPSMIAGPNMTNVNYVNYSNFWNLCLHAENLCFRTPSNPSLGCLDLSVLQAAYVKGCRFDTADAANLVVQPTHPTGIAISMPQTDNNVRTTLRDCSVTGYYVGFNLGEHTDADGLIAHRCLVGLGLIQPSGHGMRVGQASIEKCPYVIAAIAPATGVVGFSGAPPVNIALLDIEDGGGWATGVLVHVNDVDSVLRGQINYIRTGNASNVISNVGGLGISYRNLLTGPRPAVVTTPVAGLLPTDGTATNAQLSSAINQLVAAVKDKGITL